MLEHQPTSIYEIEEWLKAAATKEVKPYRLELPYNPKEQDKHKVANLIISGANSQGIDFSYAMDKWLDWLLEIFNVDKIWDKSFDENLNKQAQDNPSWFEALSRWLYEIQIGKTLDFFGMVYESEFLTSSKASRNGQFFTPIDVSRLCSEILCGKGDLNQYTTMDCACGSGRMLLAAYKSLKEEIDNDTKFHFFFAGDVDNCSVKMCALNLMIHGLQGLVINQDALALNKPRFGYLINPTNAPIRTGVLSVQYLNSDECAKFVDWQDKNGTYSNFSKTIDYYKWQWDVVHKCREQKDNCCAKNDGQQYVLDFDKE